MASKFKGDLEFNHYVALDSHRHYKVDCRLRIQKKDLFIFAIKSTVDCLSATVSIYRFLEWKVDCHAIGVFDDQRSVSRDALAKFSDVSSKQVSSLANMARLESYIESLLKP
jgi:hypothetical protein